jgi:hypothetical protein
MGIELKMDKGELFGARTGKVNPKNSAVLLQEGKSIDLKLKERACVSLPVPPDGYALIITPSVEDRSRVLIALKHMSLGNQVDAAIPYANWNNLVLEEVLNFLIQACKKQGFSGFSSTSL